MVDLGTLEIGLRLDRQTLDRDINTVKGDLAKVGRNIPQINIKPFVDHQPLKDLNEHLDKKVKHLKEVNAYFRNNPVKVIYGYEGDFGNAEIGSNRSSATVNNKYIFNTDELESKVTKGFGGIEEKLDNLSSAISKLTKAVESTKTGVFGKTIGKVFEGFFLGTGAKTGFSFGTGLEEGMGYDFRGMGQGTGKDVRRKVKRIKTFADYTIDNFINVPDGIDGLRRQIKSTGDAFYNTIFSPKTFKNLENLFVDYAHLSQKLPTIDPRLARKATRKNADPADVAMYQEQVQALEKATQAMNKQMKESAQKMFRPFINDMSSNVIPFMLGSLLKTIAQPIRVSKRLNLGNEAQMVMKRLPKIIKDITANNPQTEKELQSATEIINVVGGYQPNFSNKDHTAIESTYQLAGLVKSYYPDSFVMPVPNFYSNNVKELSKSPSLAIKKALKEFFSNNKELAGMVLGQDNVANVLSNLDMLHPVDRIVQTNLRGGYDQDAINLASKALAQAKLQPNKPVALVGGSGGGYTVERAIAILNQIAKIEPDLRDVISNITGYGIGSPISGLTKTHDSERRGIGRGARYVSVQGTDDHVSFAFYGNKYYNQRVDAIKEEIKVTKQQILAKQQEIQYLKEKARVAKSNELPEINTSITTKQKELADLIGSLGSESDAKDKASAYGRLNKVLDIRQRAQKEHVGLPMGTLDYDPKSGVMRPAMGEDHKIQEMFLSLVGKKDNQRAVAKVITPDSVRVVTDDLLKQKALIEQNLQLVSDLGIQDDFYQPST